MSMGPNRDSAVAGALHSAPQLMYLQPWEWLLFFWDHYPLEVHAGQPYYQNFKGVGAI